MSEGGAQIETEKDTPRYLVNLKRHEEANRSFSTFVESRLCSNCRSKLKANKVPLAAEELLSTTKNCCSQVPEFITPRLPLRESIFRLFLANGNQPLTADEVLQQLKERRGDPSAHLTPQVLSRLLEKDSYYGIGRESS